MAVLPRHPDQQTGLSSFRLIGISVYDLCPASEADPPDLFAVLGEEA